MINKFKLVPIEPTREMLEAGEEAENKYSEKLSLIDVEPVAQISVDKYTFKYVEWLIDNPMHTLSRGTKLYTQPPADKDAEQLIYDFGGFLTARKERLVCSSADNVSPMVEAIKEFLELRSKRDKAMEEV